MAEGHINGKIQRPINLVIHKNRPLIMESTTLPQNGLFTKKFQFSIQLYTSCYTWQIVVYFGIWYGTNDKVGHMNHWPVNKETCPCYRKSILAPITIIISRHIPDPVKLEELHNYRTLLYKTTIYLVHLSRSNVPLKLLIKGDQ